MGYTVKKALGIAAIPEAGAIRRAVFMEEQGFENEFDGLDESCLHVVLMDGEEPVGAARVFWDEERKAGHIGRVAVMKPYRGRGLGAELLRAAEEAGRELGWKRFVLGAQVRAAGFYEKSGYSRTEELFDDEGCPHVMMEKTI